MRMTLLTDCLDFMNFEDMTKTAADLGYESLEIACGNWSTAPHIDLDEMIKSKSAREIYLNTIKKQGLKIEVLNCSGNQLAPNEDGKRHQQVVEKTFQLAELLEIEQVNMMSGLPGGSPQDTTPNWVTTSWPPINNEILDWQWNEVAFPYWEKTVKQAKEHGIKKIALENHGSQLVYNAETLFRLRNTIGNEIGMNFDPSHHFWMGGEPIQTARNLKDAIYFVHAKDTRIERGMVDINGVLDTKTIDQFAERTWNYVALGHGHDISWWKEFFSIISMAGYTGPVSLEMEDLTMDTLTALKKSTNVLKEALPREL